MTIETIIEKSFKTYRFIGKTLDPVHVGTGGCRLGRVDNTIVRDPVTQIPKIPGSSLAGVTRAYVAMNQQNKNLNREVQGKKKPYYPDCAGQGGESGHCGENDCPVCTVFGFAKSSDNENKGGFAGLAGFSDMQVLLFPVASQLGPQWITCPMALRQVINSIGDVPEQDKFYCQAGDKSINLGWLLLQIKTDWTEISKVIAQMKAMGVSDKIIKNMGIVSDKLFTHIVNSNLEVRTSVSIDPATGAAKEGALFSCEALPRGTVLVWDVTCRNPEHFKINGNDVVAVKSPNDVKNIVTSADSYFEHLGIGGMGTRGMGRVKVLSSEEVQA